MAMGKHQEALTYFQKALDILTGVYEEGHPLIAVTLDNMGQVWEKMGNHEKAGHYYKQSIKAGYEK